MLVSYLIEKCPRFGISQNDIFMNQLNKAVR